jgi:hypothetical protein
VPLLTSALLRCGIVGVETALSLASDGGSCGEVAVLTCLASLQSFKQQVLVPLLIQQLSCDDATARRGSVVALGALGPAASAALPALCDVLVSDRSHAMCFHPHHRLSALRPSEAPGYEIL